MEVGLAELHIIGTSPAERLTPRRMSAGALRIRTTETTSRVHRPEEVGLFPMTAVKSLPRQADVSLDSAEVYTDFEGNRYEHDG
jgi:hypothetical protein